MISPEWQQVLAADTAKYPLPSEMRGEAPGRRLQTVKDVITHLTAGYPLPSEMRARRAAEAAKQAERLAAGDVS